MAMVSAAWGGDVIPVREAAQLLKAEFPQARLHEQGERITRVYGQPMATGAEPQESAERFVVGHAEVFGVAPDELVLTGFAGSDALVQPVMFESSTGDYKFFVARYTQQRGGIPVFRSDLRVLVRNQADFPVVLAASSLRSLGDFALPTGTTVVRHDLAEAAVAAITGRTDLAGEPLVEQAPGLTSFSEADPVIWAGVGEAAVAPALAVTYIGDNYDNPNAERPERWLFVADALTGEILYVEDLIKFTDVSGNVQGRATEGDGAEHCGDELATPLKWARVNIDATVAYTDAAGDFLIPNAGTTPVTVQSRLWGLWFRVFNAAGADSVLSELVTPPGPADFLHNSANTSEIVRAEVNAYVHSNVVRDFVLTYNPDYPGLAQSEFPVNVNRTDGYCPGNAWYDYSSINFCLSGSGYPNTAWSGIIHHEYGHHLVAMAGSGQDAYGEGMGDVMGLLIFDDPGSGSYGFLGSCSTSLRTADNTLQYPCEGAIHYCGQLLSGCVWSTRNELIVTEPADYLDILSNLAVNAMLLHSGGSITPEITIDYLTLDDDDGFIGNGTPHYAEIDAGFGAHNMPAPELVLVGFEYPEGLPELLPPNQTTVVNVNVVPIVDTPVAGTGTLSYRVGGGSFATVPMTEIAPNEYEATLPAADCLELVDYYFSVQTSGGETVTDPDGAPNAFHTAIAATGSTVVFADNFETDLRWSVENSPGLVDGPWDRGIPVNCSRGDPPTDYDGSGRCYLTDNSDGDLCNSDVDGGYTWLISPAIDLSAGDAEIRYALWYSNNYGNAPNSDLFKVHVSNDDGATWVLVETIGPVTTDAWNEYSFTVGSFVTPSAVVRVRFEASDLNDGSVVEAGVDAFEVLRFECEQVPCPGDLDGDNDIDLSDLSQLLANYGTTGGAQYEDGDLDADGDVDLSDLSALLAVYGTSCP
jgi:hypothetical protein